MRWWNGITDSMDMNLGKIQEMMKDREGSLACCSPWGHNLATEQQQEQQCLSLSNGSRDDLSSYLLAFCNKGH